MGERGSGAEAALGTLVRERAVRYPAPAGLASRIGAALDSAHAEPPHRATWWPAGLAASLVAAMVLSSAATWYLTASRHQAGLAQEVVASHIRSLLVDHLTDVASSDQHTVKPWFAGKLDLAPPVVDLTTRGFPLLGGRLDYLERRPVAALVFRHKQHIINLFIGPSPAAVTPAAPAALQGYNLRAWQDGDLAFWAVSDLNPTDLAAFERSLRGALR
jgi:anti-sigma factor RsiW